MKILRFAGLFPALLLIFSPALFAQTDSARKPSENLIRYVNPFIGTGGHGHTFPGATAPFGLVQLSPDTRPDMSDWDGCSGYHFSDSLIYGFSHTHLSGTGVPDYADVLFMPFTGGVALKRADYASTFDKTREKAEAGYYAVFLNKSKILAELTATEHVGVHRYTFPKNQESGSLLIDLRYRDEVLDSHLEVVNDQEISGYRISKAWAPEQHLYFVARFSRPFSSSILLDMTKNPIEARPAVSSKAIVALLDFANDGSPLVITVGISGVSIEGARKNLEAECQGFDFDKIRAQTQEKWQHELSAISVKSDDDNLKTTFYTALYHTMIAPNIWSDVDGKYRGRDNQIHQAKGHRVYTVFSLWDTYRACNPLYTILQPERTNDFIQTFLREYEQGGLLPIWELSANETDCMIGNHAIPVIADAYNKGIRGYDANLALEAMIHSASQDRYGMKWYRETGYIPSDKESESVSKTLEYCYDDWCISTMAKSMGREDIARQYWQRSHNYLNLFDPETHFFRAKSNATFVRPFDPFEVNFNYTEANAWQYSLAAPQGLGKASNALYAVYDNKIADRLDEIFNAKSKTTGREQVDISGMIGQYVQGNEPSHHMAYLYEYTRQPWKTPERVRQIMDEWYQNKPDGLSGNEDCGQMSAWYVFSALGFYPVTPGTADYTLGTPLFEKATLHLPNGKTFEIDAPGVSRKRFYVEKAELNGQQLAGPEITHNAITAGGTLKFFMSEQPDKKIKAEEQHPFEWPLVPAPFVREGQRSFRGEMKVALECLAKEATIHYTLDGSTPDCHSRAYSKPFTIGKTTRLNMIACLKDSSSRVETADFSRIPDGLEVLRYNTTYSPQYTAHGQDGLIDGIRGSQSDFRTGDWQGFEGVNLDVVLDLGKSRRVKEVSAGFLQDENAWIFFPEKVQVEVSENGTDFQPVGEAPTQIAPQEKGVLQQDFTVEIPGNVKARYVRVVGVSLGKCPAWHKGHGAACWLMADEIMVK